MRTEYKNLFNESITVQQKNILEDYVEILVDENSNLVKQKNNYFNNEISSIEYYIESGENEAQLVSSLSQLNPTVCIKEVTPLTNYSIEVEREYRTTVLKFKSRYLLDEKDRIICSEPVDSNTNLPLYDETEKYHFSDNKVIEDLYARYTASGNLDYIIYKTNGDEEQDWEYYDQTNFSELQSKFTEDLSYYLTADLESPFIV
ncbi:MAG TPA: hypothetical protein VJL37_11530 [Flavobacterium sp.]|nr:hypothetical protein [Flavobacterium sp.]